VLMPSTDPAPKRVVFVHDDGIHQILGTATDPPVALVPEGDAIEVRGRIIPFASLYRVTTRAAYYKAPTVPSSGQTLHEAQR